MYLVYQSFAEKSRKGIVLIPFYLWKGEKREGITPSLKLIFN